LKLNEMLQQHQIASFPGSSENREISITKNIEFTKVILPISDTKGRHFKNIEFIFDSGCDAHLIIPRKLVLANNLNPRLLGKARLRGVTSKESIKEDLAIIYLKINGIEASVKAVISDQIVDALIGNPFLSIFDVHLKDGQVHFVDRSSLGKKK